MNLNQANKILLLSLLLSTTVVADETNTGKTNDVNEIITPENMSPEDGRMLNEYANHYDHCLRDTSIEQMQVLTDSRHVVDYAMKACAGTLYELEEKMTARNFDPDFRRGYLRSISNRSANNILRFVMMSMANRNSVEVKEAEE